MRRPKRDALLRTVYGSSDAAAARYRAELAYLDQAKARIQAEIVRLEAEIAAEKATGR